MSFEAAFVSEKTAYDKEQIDLVWVSFTDVSILRQQIFNHFKRVEPLRCQPVFKVGVVLG